MEPKDLENLIRGMRIPHPHYQGAERETLAQPTTTPPDSEIVLFGPTRVGKSSILEKAARSALGEQMWMR